VTTALEQTSDVCVVDLSAVTFLGTAGLDALLAVTALAGTRREPPRIVVAANGPLTLPIQLTGLDTVLALYPTVEDAIRHRT